MTTIGAKVEVEFDPINHPGTWTDITADVDYDIGISMKFGRTSEFSAPQSAVCNLTLNDPVGNYTALNAASPYYPNIRPRRRLRVSNSAGPRFVGYIKGWPPEYEGTRRVVRISAADRMDPLARRTLKSTPMEQILGDSPTYYFPMNDGGGSGSSPLYVHEYAGQLPPGPYSLYANGGTGASVAGGTASPAGPWDSTTWTKFVPAMSSGVAVGGWEAVIGGGTQITLNSRSFALGIAFQALNTSLTASTGNLLLTAYTGPQDQLNTNRVLSVNYQPPFTGLSVVGPGSISLTASVVNDTQPHMIHLVCGNSGVALYFDGALVASQGAAVLVTPNAYFVVADYINGPANANIAHIALWQGLPLPTSTQVANQATAVLSGFAGELSGATINRVLTYAGLGASDINAMAGVETIGGYPQAGKTVVAAMQEIAVTEGGGAVAFVDVDGRVRFNDRTFRNPGAPVMTLDAIKDLDGTNFVPSYDELTLVNASAVTDSTTGNVSTYTDTVSVAEFQQTSDSATSFAATDQAALNLAQDRVSRQSQPALRVSRLATDMLTAETITLAQLQNVSIGSRLRVANIPTTDITPAGTMVRFPVAQLDVSVEGWTETMKTSGYPVVFDTSTTDVPPRMLWNDATYGLWQADPGTLLLSAAITATATGMGVTASVGHPTLTTSAGDFPLLIQIDQEIIQVTAYSAGSWTIVRGQKGSTAAAHAIFAVVSVYPTATWTL